MSARLRLPARAPSASPSAGTSRRSTLTRGLAVAGVAVFLATGAAACNPPSSSSGRPSASQLYALRMCESGGNYRINTGNGFYGAYQFDRGTWQGLGYGGLPNQASAATQDAAVRKLYARRGWAPWPSCGQRARYA